MGGCLGWDRIWVRCQGDMLSLLEVVGGCLDFIYFWCIIKWDGDCLGLSVGEGWCMNWVGSE